MHPFEISVTDFFELYKKNNKVFILDVRALWELQKVSWKGNITHIPLASLPERQSELPRDYPLYIVCHHGVRSLKAAFFLREEGFEAYSLKGGVDAWAREIDSSVGFY